MAGIVVSTPVAQVRSQDTLRTCHVLVAAVGVIRVVLLVRTRTTTHSPRAAVNATFGVTFLVLIAPMTKRGALIATLTVQVGSTGAGKVAGGELTMHRPNVQARIRDIHFL